MERVNVTCRLAIEDVAFLDSLANAFERDRSYLIKKAVSEYIETQRWQLDEIRQSIAEAEAGIFATEEEVRAAFAELRS
jgi:predicted transcriptional regulator